MSKTISITIPDKLEKMLQTRANQLGISRSRFITNILLDWQLNFENKLAEINKCPLHKVRDRFENNED